METRVLLLTDVEGSTRLWHENPTAMDAAMRRHHALVHSAIAAHGGVRPIDQGEGDAVFGAFRSPAAAVAAAVRIQRALAREDFPTSRPLRVRIGLHVGDVIERDGNLYGDPVNRCARLRGLATGGQTLLSAALYEVVRDELPPGVTARDLGEHRMKDLSRAERVYQLCGEGLDGPFPALAGLDVVRHNLPVQTSTFVGREAELRELVRLVREHRLVTLTGFGGMGKTRLALQAAAELADGSLGDVWFVDLSTVSGPSLVPARIAEAMGLRWGSGEPADAVREAVRARPALLVLDNLEQVLDSAAFVTDLLATETAVRVLATSREPLRVRGEQQVEVPPMRLPDDPPPDPTTVLGYEGVQLFVDRAAAVRPGFAVDDHNVATVAAVCRRLDGHPLALELAAARLKVLSVDRLLQRLDASLALLTDGPRDVPDRHRTLRATIAWSYDALKPTEQLLLGRLAVLPAPADLEAVEEICGDGPDALSVLESLVDKSLVRTFEDGGDVRYGLLASIGEYALEQLSAGEVGHTQDRHAQHFLRRLEPQRDDPGAEGVRQQVVARELAHLRAAVAHRRAAGDVSGEVELVVALRDYLAMLGHVAEYLTLSERALSLTADVVQRASLHMMRSVAYSHVPDIEMATTEAKLAVDAARTAGDRRLLAPALALAARGATTEDELNRHADELESVLSATPQDWQVAWRIEIDNVRAGLLRLVNPPGAEAAARRLIATEYGRDVGSVRLAVLLIDRGKYHEAVAALEATEAAAEAFHGQQTWQLAAMSFGALARIGTGELERARHLAETAFARQQDLGIRPDFSALALAWLARIADRPEDGLAALDAALDARFRTDDAYAAATRVWRAVLLRQRGRPADAHRELDAARPELLRDPPRGALGLLCALVVRAVLVAPEDPRRAAALVGCVEAHLGAWVLPFGLDRDLEELRATLLAECSDDVAGGQALDVADAW